ncbi:MAG: 4-hydroxy-3-methylbut-2-enyl diphosphate reductase [Bacteroidetes bacterium]|nr:4-hydroxy-3-methylbut-2-enyl diphosphate reductase [Bacteroidota bacterium]
MLKQTQTFTKSLGLTVSIDQNSGFCFGVVYAIAMAEEVLDQQGYLYCLGDIVHNDEEVKRLKDKGLRVIDHAQLEQLRDEKVLIRAHGEPPSTYRKAIENNITLIDATCPVVLKLQNRIRNSHDKKETIFLMGKSGHAEVTGLMGQINNEGVVFSDVSELDGVQLPEEITLYTQTTKSKQKFQETRRALESRGIKVNAHDTICSQVSDRDSELRQFAGSFDKILFVGGTKSSNGKVLFEVCRDCNPNTYFISSAAEIDFSWFKPGDRVGICGATSTPMWLMKEVEAVLLSA